VHLAVAIGPVVYEVIVNCLLHLLYLVFLVKFKPYMGFLSHTFPSCSPGHRRGANTNKEYLGSEVDQCD